jgi:HEAT repeat protein
MFRRITLMATMAVVASASASSPGMAQGDLASALEALKEYDWGSDRAVLEPIDKAVTAASNDADVQTALEGKLISALDGDLSNCARDYLCRKLSLIGSKQCVDSVARLLADEELSHIARYALERIPDDEAVSAMRKSMTEVSGNLQIGIINSLGVRRDEQSVVALTRLLNDSNDMTVTAALTALGSIGNAEAADALKAYQNHAPDKLKLVAADAYLRCAEQLLKAGKKIEAMAIYKSLMTHKAKHIGLAARRGLLAAAQAK